MIEERKEYIEKLNKQIQTIKRILQMNSGDVISDEMRSNIEKIKKEAERVLKKLENDEFEIAIVGMEKAGKSTFANALMENNLLPSKDLRCTFTPTQIRYCRDQEEDSAVVSFYSTETFNRDFKDKLFKLGIEEYDRYSFDNLPESQYLKMYEEQVDEAKRKAYGDIHDDILAIIRNVASFETLLGKPDILFSGNAMENGQLEAYITDEIKARAVKNVIIYSSKLSKMQNAIIFDVPGFNSPTELHKVQTRERMKSADAIIVVANGTNPSLTDEALKILHESDNDGNPLNDKLFVFANKIEGSRNIVQNVEDTKKQWIEKNFVSSENSKRIIAGSALAYLQEKGLDEDKRCMELFNQRREELSFGTGIDEMRRMLEEYNRCERFEVLKRRVNRINVDILKLFSNVEDSYDEGSAGKALRNENLKAFTSYFFGKVDAIQENLKELKDKIKREIPNTKPLSSQIDSYVENNINCNHWGITDEMVRKAQINTMIISEKDFVTKMEIEIRENQFTKMYNDFSSNVIFIAEQYHSKYSQEIVDIIMNILEIEASSPYYEDMEKAIKNQLAKYRCDINNDSNEKGVAACYQSLIERFSRDIYEILILIPYNADRLIKFYAAINNFFCLSVFYNENETEGCLDYINIPPREQPLCKMLLFHDYFGMQGKTKELIKELAGKIGVRELTKEVCKAAEKALIVTNGDGEKIIAVVNEILDRIFDKTDNFKQNELCNLLEEKIIKYSESYNIANEEKFTKYYKQYHASLKNEMTTIEDVKEYFNQDIMILQNILKNAFIGAINMETPFVAYEAKSIDDIIEYINGIEFHEFITENYSKIKYEQIEQLDKKQRKQEQNVAIMREIKELLNLLQE